MNRQRTVFCKKLAEELPALPFRPFPDDFGKELYENISLQAWQMWLRESPRYINTYGWDLQSKEGRAALVHQMRIFFGFEEGDQLGTAWRPPPPESSDSE